MRKSCLYFNEKNGYYIVPQIRAKDVPAWVSVNVLEKVGVNSDEELGKSVKKSLNISESIEAPRLADAKKIQYWTDLGYKSFGTFSKQHLAVQIECDDEKIFLTKLVRDSKGAYEKSKVEGDSLVLSVGVANTELAIEINKILNIDSVQPKQNEKSIITLGKSLLRYAEPDNSLVDCGDGGTDAYQIYKEDTTGNYIAFLIDNGYESLSEPAIRCVLERQFGLFNTFSYDNNDDKKLIIKATNNKCTIESNILILRNEYVEIQLYEKSGIQSIISDEYHRIIDSIKN